MNARGWLQAHRSRVALLARLTDISAVVLSAWVSDVIVTGTWTLKPTCTLVCIIGVLLSTLLFSSINLYETWRGYPLSRELLVLLRAWTAMFFIIAAVALVTKTGNRFSRLWIGYWFISGAGMLTALRVCLRYLLHTLRARGFNRRTIVIVGNGRLAARLVGRVERSPWTGFRILGCFTEAKDCADTENEALSVLGELNELADYVETRGVDQVWFALSWDRQDLIRSVLHDLRYSTADIRMVPDIFSYRLLNQSMSEIAGMPVLNLATTPMDGVARLAKTLEDRLLALVILIVISPLLALLCLGIKLTSRGPIIFKQLRHGWAGEQVEIWKLRTMVVHQENRGTVTQARIDDRRVTRFGKFLRRNSLDELPQFINVLQGRMSIVGPRPHALAHTEHYKKKVLDYMLRHKVKPGITGWAQVNGLRGGTDNVQKMTKRIEHDLYYIENWSVGFDLRIIASTVWAVFSGRNAY